MGAAVMRNIFRHGFTRAAVPCTLTSCGCEKSFTLKEKCITKVPNSNLSQQKSIIINKVTEVVFVAVLL